MKTSYFANLHNLTAPLSISSRPPEWYGGPQCKLLAPPWPLVLAYKNGEVTAEEYARQFQTDVLAKLHAPDLHARLTADYGEDVTLLCYEKAGDFCHRRLVAEWFEREAKVEVPEWEPPPRKINGLEF